MSMSGEYEAYTAFSEGMRLLADDNAHAAVIALEQARELEPAKGSVREALARAYFRTGRFQAAEQEFAAALDIEPVNDYAQFGIGLCRLRAGDRTRARGHLRLATVMRPDNAAYQAALEQVTDTESSETDSSETDSQ
jgi:tetratricopeptide (TPR) repeat protein